MAQIEEYPKFQYSEFIRTSTQDGQFVVRADSIEEFKKNLAEIREALKDQRNSDGTMNTGREFETPPHPAEQPQGFQTKCMVIGCKADAIQRHGISKKNGKPYNAVFCSVNKDHVKFL